MDWLGEVQRLELAVGGASSPYQLDLEQAAATSQLQRPHQASRQSLDGHALRLALQGRASSMPAPCASADLHGDMGAGAGAHAGGSGLLASLQAMLSQRQQQRMAAPSELMHGLHMELSSPHAAEHAHAEPGFMEPGQTIPNYPPPAFSMPVNHSYPPPSAPAVSTAPAAARWYHTPRLSESGLHVHGEQPMDSPGGRLGDPWGWPEEREIGSESDDDRRSAPEPVTRSALAVDVPMPDIKGRQCRCKKSQCLKLYCDCFAAQMFCVGCACADCKNQPDNLPQIQERQQQLKLRNRQAFTEKIQGDEESGTVRHAKGCKCKRSNCLKKYCECFQSSIRCSDTCKCTDCMNISANFPESLLGAPGAARGARADSVATSSKQVKAEPLSRHNSVQPVNRRTSVGDPLGPGQRVELLKRMSVSSAEAENAPVQVAPRLMKVAGQRNGGRMPEASVPRQSLPVERSSAPAWVEPPARSSIMERSGSSTADCLPHAGQWPSSAPHTPGAWPVDASDALTARGRDLRQQERRASVAGCEPIVARYDPTDVGAPDLRTALHRQRQQQQQQQEGAVGGYAMEVVTPEGLYVRRPSTGVRGGTAGGGAPPPGRQSGMQGRDAMPDHPSAWVQPQQGALFEHPLASPVEEADPAPFLGFRPYSQAGASPEGGAWPAGASVPYAGGGSADGGGGGGGGGGARRRLLQHLISGQEPRQRAESFPGSGLDHGQGQPQGGASSPQGHPGPGPSASSHLGGGAGALNSPGACSNPSPSPGACSNPGAYSNPSPSPRACSNPGAYSTSPDSPSAASLAAKVRRRLSHAGDQSILASLAASSFPTAAGAIRRSSTPGGSLGSGGGGAGGGGGGAGGYHGRAGVGGESWGGERGGVARSSGEYQRGGHGSAGFPPGPEGELVGERELLWQPGRRGGSTLNPYPQPSGGHDLGEEDGQGQAYARAHCSGPGPGFGPGAGTGLVAGAGAGAGRQGIKRRMTWMPDGMEGAGGGRSEGGPMALHHARSAGEPTGAGVGAGWGDSGGEAWQHVTAVGAGYGELPDGLLPLPLVQQQAMGMGRGVSEHGGRHRTLLPPRSFSSAGISSPGAGYGAEARLGPLPGSGAGAGAGAGPGGRCYLPIADPRVLPSLPELRALGDGPAALPHDEKDANVADSHRLSEGGSWFVGGGGGGGGGALTFSQRARRPASVGSSGLPGAEMPPPGHGWQGRPSPHSDSSRHAWDGGGRGGGGGGGGGGTQGLMSGGGSPGDGREWGVASAAAIVVAPGAPGAGEAWAERAAVEGQGAGAPCNPDHFPQGFFNCVFGP